MDTDLRTSSASPPLLAVSNGPDDPHGRSGDGVEWRVVRSRRCEPCQAYLATYRRAVELGAAGGRVEMPAEMKARLREFLLSTLRDVK